LTALVQCCLPRRATCERFICIGGSSSRGRCDWSLLAGTVVLTIDVTTMGDTNDEIEDVENMHQIQNKYTFWYRANTGNAAKTVNYNDSIKKMASFQTVRCSPQ
jgi:hypothetical protein